MFFGTDGSEPVKHLGNLVKINCSLIWARPVPLLFWGDQIYNWHHELLYTYYLFKWLEQVYEVNIINITIYWLIADKETKLRKVK